MCVERYWDRLSSCVIIGISDGVSNCTFGDVKLVLLFSSYVRGGIL